MYDIIRDENSELINVLHYGPYVYLREFKEGEVKRMVTKSRREFNINIEKKLRKNTRPRNC